MAKELYKLVCKDKYYWFALSAAMVIWITFAFISQKSLSFEFSGHNTQKIFLIVLLYPLIEEIVFRGLIQSYLQVKIRQSSVRVISHANINTSILFVTLHIFYQPMIWALIVFIPSIVFGYFKEKYNSLLPSIFLHSYYNAGFIIFIS